MGVALDSTKRFVNKCIGKGVPRIDSAIRGGGVVDWSNERYLEVASAARHLQVEMVVSTIQKEAAMVRWKHLRNASTKVRCLVAREYAEALKRYKRAAEAWSKHLASL